MSNSAPSDHTRPAAQAQRKRRALVIGALSAANLRTQLSLSGYAAEATNNATGQDMLAEFAPDVAIIVLERSAEGAEHEGIALARRLREEPVTHALPLVLVYAEEERLMRGTALNIGVDDCFGIWTPYEQVLARLDALFWRIEAGRRAASMVGDQRLEIDNFIVLLDAVREDMKNMADGTLALVYAIALGKEGKGLDKHARDRTLAEAHGFFKLNLRRIDAVGFYGPTTLLIYLPRTKAHAAIDILVKLRDEFLNERTDIELAIGLASFPEDGNDVESLVEQAESAASLARSGTSKTRVVRSQAPRHLTPAVPSVRVLKAGPRPIAPLSESKTAHPAEVSHAGNRELRTEHEPVPKAGQKDSSSTPAPARAAAAAPPASTAATTAATQERSRRAQGAIMPRRLLLTVSDAARMAQLNALIRSAGYEARTAFDGQQALDLLRIERPDLLLLDYELQGIDGVEMLRRLRKQNGGRLTLPVIMLMAPAHEHARREALELGAHGIISMPYDPAELLESVRRAGGVD